MKKILFLSLLGGLALCSSAQLVVNPRGQLVAGKQTAADSGTSISSVALLAQPDSLSQIAVLGIGKDYSGGYLSFGGVQAMAQSYAF